MNNQQQLYFPEDSANNTIQLSLTYYDANKLVIVVNELPQFFVNGQPFTGNTYRFERAGQYTFSAQVGDSITRISRNWS